jgi:hypothetical protein
VRAVLFHPGPARSTSSLPHAGEPQHHQPTARHSARPCWQISDSACLASPFRLDRLAFPEHNTLRPLERHTVRGKPVAPRCSAMALQIARAVRVFLLDKRTPLIARLTQQCLSSTGSSATHRSPPSFGLSGPARRHHYHQDDRHSRALGRVRRRHGRFERQVLRGRPACRLRRLALSAGYMAAQRHATIAVSGARRSRNLHGRLCDS